MNIPMDRCCCGCGADATRGLYTLTQHGLRLAVDEVHAARANLPPPLRCFPVPPPATLGAAP
jgi:hypothetical protein